MTLALFAPGTRKGNKFWMVRGYHDGCRREISTKTTDRAAAKRFLRELERELAADRLPKAGDRVTFAQAAALYAEFRGLDLANPKTHPGQQRVEVRAINQLVALIGKEPLAELGQTALVRAANQLYPTQAPATRNRWVLKPGAAILHYAAQQKLTGWERIAKFKEKRPATRAVSYDVAVELIAAAPPGPRRLLLVWLFRQGTRISDTLQVRWDDLNLARQTVRLRIGKADEWTELPLHAELFELIAAIPLAERQAWLFPWRQKSGVYRWLRPLARELGIAFTPHMARHSLGTWLNHSGAGLRTIMDTLHHRDPKSSIRYQSADVEVIRAATARIAPITK